MSSFRMLKIGYSPYSGKENDYINRMKELISCASGSELLPIPSTKEFLKNPFAFQKSQFDYTIVNWIDNDIVSQKSGKFTLSGLIKFIAKIILIKYLSKKTIFVRHNNYPHHTANGFGNKAASLIDFFEKWFTLAVTHSGHNATTHRIYIPHPLYTSDTSDTSGVNHHANGSYFLIFGRILPYKKIKEFIDCCTINQKIIIAGPCSDTEYLSQIKTASKGKNIEILPDFLEEQDAKKLVINSSGLILCHSDPNMVVSGSYFYAASLGVPVFAKNSPFFNWLSTTRDAIGLHTFNTFEDLIEGLAHGAIDNDHSAIKHFAADNFGDSIVINHWTKTLNQLDSSL